MFQDRNGEKVLQGLSHEVDTPGLHRCPESHWAQETVMDFAEAPPTSQNENFQHSSGQLSNLPNPLTLSPTEKTNLGKRVTHNCLV